MSRKNQNKKTGWIIAGIIAVVAIIACIFLGNYLVKEKARQEKEAQKNKTYEEIALEISTDKKTEEEFKSPINFEELQAINADAYAWIQIPGTNIDYPVMQKEEGDQAYYLNTSLTGKTGFPGSIYTENYTSKDFQDNNSIIYGHDLKDGTMFSQLHKFSDAAFMSENPYVYIYMPDRTLKYQIYAAVVFDDNHLLSRFDFNNPESYQSFLDETFSKKDMKSVVNENVPVSIQDKIITMSTCIANQPNNRWLVEAVLVDEKN